MRLAVSIASIACVVSVAGVVRPAFAQETALYALSAQARPTQPPPQQPPQQPPSTPRPQPQPARPTAAPPRHVFGFRAFFLEDYNALAAKKSFDAVTGSSGFAAPGGGVEVLKIWRSVFARFAISKMSIDGERVAVIDGTVLPLGVPLTIEMMPIELGAGWRFENLGRRPPATPARPGQPAPPSGQPPATTPRPGQPPPQTPPSQPPPRPGQPGQPPSAPPAPPARPGQPAAAPQPRPSRFVPYIGAGLVALKYKEESDFAGEGENTNQMFNGFAVFGGLEVMLTKLIFAGGEAQFRGISNAIGDAGVSKEFGEKNLGGFTVRFLIGVRR